jgi:ribosome-associated heat shock protein Hsp15
LAQRLDKWLVYARFVKHRSLASELIEQGRVRLNKLRVSKCSHVVKPDDVLTLALGGTVRVIRVLGEAERRGSAVVANTLYEDLSLDENSDAQREAVCYSGLHQS